MEELTQSSASDVGHAHRYLGSYVTLLVIKVVFDTCLTQTLGRIVVSC